MLRLLIIDDDPDVLMAAKLLLKRHFGHVDIEKNPERIPFLITNGHYDAILLDMNFQRDLSSGREGFFWLDRILDIDPSAAVVLITAYGDVEMAVRAMKVGAKDFVLKPWQNDKLVATIEAAMGESGKAEKDKAEKGEAIKQTGKSTATRTNFIAQSSAMKQVLDTVSRVANTDANVLILGENGTGKDLIARMIHEQSGRSAKPFVPVDVGALSESLFESELFGHVKGAFTDARDDRAGRFEEAQGGTVFLDEIGNITLPQQARLLTVLQQRQVTRLGSNKAKAIDVRLICATNANITERVANRDFGGPAFRQDLLYRINTIELHLPALRDRPDDIEPLANHFLQQYRKQYNRPITGMSPALVRHLKQHRWPGNVRELQHAVERAVILTQGTLLEPADFFGGQAGSSAGLSANTALADSMQLDDMERRLIQQAMQKYGGNITDVARELGLSRQALYRRLEKYGM